MYRKLLVISLNLLLCGVAFSQSAPNDVPKSKLFDEVKLVDDLRILSADDMEGRAPETPGAEKARVFVLKRFKESGLLPFGSSFEQKYDFTYGKWESEYSKKPKGTTYQGVNVIGFIQGNHSPEKYIVVSAHYDHLGIRDGKIYNGADDNASGTASLFTIAKYFKKHRPANSVIFVAFDTEEGSGAGGLNFVNSPPVPLSSIVMNVNIDMIGRDFKDTVYAVGTYHYPFLKPYLDRVAAKVPFKLLFGHDVPNDKEDWTGGSDHIHFHARHIPFIYFGVEDFAQHHKVTDDFETMTLPLFVHTVEAIIGAIKEFDANLPEIEKHKAAIAK